MKRTREFLSWLKPDLLTLMTILSVCLAVTAFLVALANHCQ